MNPRENLNINIHQITDPSLLIDLGIRYHSGERYAEAIPVLTRAIELDRLSQEWLHYNFRSKCYKALNKFDLALQDILCARKIVPDNDWCISEEISLRLKLEQWQTVVDLCSNHLVPSRKCSLRYFDYAYALAELDRHREAVLNWLAVLSYNKYHYAARFNLGLTYVALKDYPNAADAFAKVVQDNPEDVEAREQLRDALKKAQRYNEVLRQSFEIYQLTKAERVQPLVDYARFSFLQHHETVHQGNHFQKLMAVESDLYSEIKPQLPIKLRSSLQHHNMTRDSIAHFANNPSFLKAHPFFDRLDQKIDEYDEACEPPFKRRKL